MYVLFQSAHPAVLQVDNEDLHIVADTVEDIIQAFIDDLKYYLEPEHHNECDLCDWDSIEEGIQFYQTLVELLENKEYEVHPIDVDRYSVYVPIVEVLEAR